MGALEWSARLSHWEGFRVVSRNLPKYTECVWAHEGGMADDGGGSQYEDPVGNAVSWSLSLSCSQNYK